MKFSVASLHDIEGAMRYYARAHAEETHSGDPQVHWETYYNLDRQGRLFVASAVREGVVVGYYVAVLSKLLNLEGMSATTSLLWLDPLFRKGMVGSKFISFIEESLIKLGIRKIFIGIRVFDQLPLFKRLGYSETEVVLEKELE